LRWLTDHIENIVCAIEESKDLTTLSVEELAGSLEAHSSEEGRRRSPLIKHSKQRQPLGRRRFLILRTLEAEVVEAEEDMKEVKNRSANKIGVDEDKVEVVVVEAEEVIRTTQELSASNVVSTVILLKTATQESNVTIVGRLDISRRTADLKARRKQTSFLRTLRKKEY